MGKHGEERERFGHLSFPHSAAMAMTENPPNTARHGGGRRGLSDGSKGVYPSSGARVYMAEAWVTSLGRSQAGSQHPTLDRNCPQQVRIVQFGEKQLVGGSHTSLGTSMGRAVGWFEPTRCNVRLGLK
jgi:hypothetical protein